MFLCLLSSKVKNDSQRTKKCIRWWLNGFNDTSFCVKAIQIPLKTNGRIPSYNVQCWHESFSLSLVWLHTFILPWHIENNTVCDFNCNRETKRSILLQTGTKIALNSGHTTKSTHKISIQIPNPECVFVRVCCFKAFLLHDKLLRSNKILLSIVLHDTTNNNNWQQIINNMTGERTVFRMDKRKRNVPEWIRGRLTVIRNIWVLIGFLFITARRYQLYVYFVWNLNGLWSTAVAKKNEFKKYIKHFRYGERNGKKQQQHNPFNFEVTINIIEDRNRCFAQQQQPKSGHTLGIIFLWASW